MSSLLPKLDNFLKFNLEKKVVNKLYAMLIDIKDSFFFSSGAGAASEETIFTVSDEAIFTAS